MRVAGAHMPALAHDAPVIDDHASDARIWIGRVQAARGQIQRLRRMRPILRCQGLAHFSWSSAASPGNRGN